MVRKGKEEPKPIVYEENVGNEDYPAFETKKEFKRVKCVEVSEFNNKVTKPF